MGFDIVIANPPYVRHEKIKDQKDNLKRQDYIVFNSTSDLYTYFYEKGYDLLKDNGILTFISSNKWLRAQYGEKLRKFLKEKTENKKIIDFGGYKVFNATVDTNILIFKKAIPDPSHEIPFVNIEDDFNKNNLTEYFERKKIAIKQSELSDSAWTLADDKVLALKKKIEKTGKPLKDWDVKIYRGVLTGYNEAFIIDTETKNTILKNCKDEDERKRTEEIIKLILRGRDIGRYYYKWAGLWLIKIESGWTNQNRGKIKPEEFFKNTFQSLYDHFISLEGIKGKGRGLSNRDDQGDYWWELRDCAYYSEFEQEKVVYPCIMTKEPRFAYENKHFYLPAPANIITGKDMKYLVALLNSKFIYFALKHYYMGGGIEGELKTNNLLKLPIPPVTPQNQLIVSQIESLVDQILAKKKSNPNDDTYELEHQIDQLIYKLYDLTDEEIKIIEGRNETE